ncbi:hypothetical protein XENOCAPTIV_028421 [Xenoophorus captivus]|uniref:Uncharacterized protein n=1 Tax=Xenoophorus captivus TaxID=1517983 RepID=A0ABV0RK22_9TELE
MKQVTIVGKTNEDNNTIIHKRNQLVIFCLNGDRPLLLTSVLLDVKHLTEGERLKVSYLQNLLGALKGHQRKWRKCKKLFKKGNCIFYGAMSAFHSGCYRRL